MELNSLLRDHGLARVGYLGCALVLAGLLPAASVWGADLAVTVEPLIVDMSPHDVNFATLQLVYDPAESDGSVDLAQTPFRLYVVGTDESNQQARALAMYSLADNGWQKRGGQPLDNAVKLLQLVAGSTPSRLLLYAGATLSRLNSITQVVEPLLELPSIYRANPVELDAEIDFARELTGDNRDDLLIPDFDGWRFSAAKADGSFSEPQLFGPQPLMNVGSARYVNFTANTPYVFDHNQDGRLDVAFWNDDALQVYYQSDAAVFSTTPVRMSVSPEIETDAFFSLSVGSDEDNPNGRQVLLDGIEDLDGDGLPEMVVYSVSGEGLFGKESRYEIHRGLLNAKKQLTFEATASSVVGSGGIQIDAERLDLNGDGTLEMMVTSFDLGIGSIIRGLLSRTVNLQLAIYEMRDGRYPETPAITRKVTAKLDIGNGDIFVPAVLAGDVDGDGRKDLLVQDGDSQLKVFVGQNSKNLFARNPITLEIELPLGEGSIQVVNLDGDADDDLLVVFDADKSEQKQPRIHAVRFFSDG